MSSATTPSEVKREQDGDETVVVDPLLHRNGTNSNHPMTPPDHQNDVIMKVNIVKQDPGSVEQELKQIPRNLVHKELENRLGRLITAFYSIL